MVPHHHRSLAQPCHCCLPCQCLPAHATAPERAMAPVCATAPVCARGHPHARHDLRATGYPWPWWSTPGSGHEATSVKSNAKPILGLLLEGSHPMHQGRFGEQRWAPSKNVSVGAGEAGHRHRQQRGTGGLWSPGGARDGAAETVPFHRGMPRESARLGSVQRSSTAKPLCKATVPWLPLPAPPSLPQSRSILPHGHTGLKPKP